MPKPITIKTYLSHAAFWLGFLSFYVFVLNGPFTFEKALTQSVINLSVIIPLAYFNMAVLTPKYVSSQSKAASASLIILLIIIGASILTFFHEINLLDAYKPDGFSDRMQPFNNRMPSENLRMQNQPEDGEWSFRARAEPGFSRRIMWFPMFIQTGTIILLTTIYKVTQIASERIKETLMLKSEKLDSELRFLKSQINPHFLFNAMNNIYTLSLLKSDKTPEVVLKLSDMLKYNIYESENKERVPVSKEVAYINNYIAIYILKDNDIKDNIKFEYDTPEDVYLAPMLLTPFVENAFKHGNIEDTSKGRISIDLKVEADLLTFRCQNSLSANKKSKDKEGGIGIANVKRRLELIYPGRHELKTWDTAEEFTVEMKILIS
ncbi:histidine kinase [Imperialibacter roseus]|uniref:Histidine kinase n=1 Tax=Imperialibacter roseus TaxID=1324217 RepID=A0ABZ0IQ56_9BACT|nr:histidine kinase [Imperialibacter roseus]WOK07168.1 histidine kinase [Imperialibacter roseus]